MEKSNDCLENGRESSGCLENRSTLETQLRMALEAVPVSNRRVQTFARSLIVSLSVIGGPLA